MRTGSMSVGLRAWVFPMLVAVSQLPGLLFSAPQQPAAALVRTTTRLVQLSVIATDNKGEPVGKSDSSRLPGATLTGLPHTPLRGLPQARRRREPTCGACAGQTLTFLKWRWRFLTARPRRVSDAFRLILMPPTASAFSLSGPLGSESHIDATRPQKT